MAVGFKRAGAGLLVLGVICAGAGWLLSAPRFLSAQQLAGIDDGDATRGRDVFYAGGCSSCHAAPKAKGDDRLKLGGGVRLVTEFGTFIAPNISQDKADGIGNWSASDLANAMMRGVTPEGSHLYPAFPYTSYARMKISDIADLHAFLKTTPEVSGKAPPNELSFPFTFRRGLGLWKLINLSDAKVVSLPDDASDEVKRGQYLAEGPGHCGECHTPRNLSGGVIKSAWLAGARAAEGKGIVPNITPEGRNVKDWSKADLVEYFTSGFTPDYDSVGGAMVEVQENLAQLSDADREAIAAYLKVVPAHANGYPAPRPKN